LPGKSYSVPEVNIRWNIQVEIHEAVQHDGRKRSRARQSHVATIIRRLVHSRPDGAPEDSEHEQQGSQGSGSAEFGEVLPVIVVGEVDGVHGRDYLESREAGFVCAEAISGEGLGGLGG
jgi:hypothetical protein